MHPILRVTHCLKCHDFYNSGEFSRGEDGSELYCRWCGQGGEVYCCSNCPYVFCKSCIVKNLKRDVISDIEKNENWLCFSCSPKILWPLRSQHWALMQFIAQQTEEIQSQVLEADEYEKRMNHDSSHCCRLARSRASNISGSVDSLNSSSSKKSDIINNVKKRKRATILMSPSPTTSKRQKVNHSYSNKSSSSNSNGNDNTSSMNDEVVCTPDLVSMLEPDCQLSASPQTMDPPSSVNTSTPPPLVLRNSSVQIRSIRDGSAYPNQTSMNSPVYHVVNGFRIDLNSAAQQGSVRLPNGKVIQVKRTGGMPSIPSPAQSPYAVSPSTNTNNANYTSINNNWPRPCEVRPIISQQPLALPRVNFPHSITSLPTVASINMNNISGNNLNTNNNNNNNNGDSAAVRLPIVRQVFPKTAIGEGRSHLQDKVLEAQSICHRFSGKLISFTNSNAYKDVKSYTDLKELYIHMSFMCTYVAESMQKLQDDVLQEMRLLGFGREADDLKQGQLPAGVDYLRTPEEVPETYAGSDDDYNDDYDEDTNGDVNGDVASLCSNGKVKHEVKNGEPNESSLGQLLEDADNSEEGAGDENEEYQEEERSKLGTEEAMYREEQAHTNDHKLTRLVQQYPAIWCTMHPNYGNFEVTRQHWRNIASYFARTDNVKARWKNIRKRFVRVEQRLRDGKRFKGSFDKASNFLLNRNIPPEDWQEVDCGTDDSDGYFIDRAARGKGAATKKDNVEGAGNIFCEKANPNDNLPIDILPIDMKIINYVKRTPVLWRRVRNGNSHDEDSIRQLWVTLVKTLPGVSCDDIVYRWHYLYEMYKAFRLKHIKNKQLLANMELKYSKYLSKLYFLYKIDEDVLRNECTMVNDDAYELEGLEEHLEYSENDPLKRMQEEPDDKKFALALIRTVSAYPALYDMRHFDYGDPIVRGKNWLDVSRKLANFKRKRNNLTEDIDDIQIIEQDTDTICLDSDDESTGPTFASSWPEHSRAVYNPLKSVPIPPKPIRIGFTKFTYSKRPIKSHVPKVPLPNASDPLPFQPPLIQPQLPVVQAQSPLIQPQTPIVQYQLPLVQPQLPIVQPQLPIVQPQPPIVQPQLPMVQLQPQFVQPHLQDNQQLLHQPQSKAEQPQLQFDNIPTAVYNEDNYMLATQAILASMFDLEESPTEKTQKRPPRPKQIRMKKKRPIVPGSFLSLVGNSAVPANLKHNDKKLRMSCRVNLTRVENLYPFGKNTMKKPGKSNEDIKNVTESSKENTITILEDKDRKSQIKIKKDKSEEKTITILEDKIKNSNTDTDKSNILNKPPDEDNEKSKSDGKKSKEDNNETKSEDNQSHNEENKIMNNKSDEDKCNIIDTKPDEDEKIINKKSQEDDVENKNFHEDGKKEKIINEDENHSINKDEHDKDSCITTNNEKDKTEDEKCIDYDDAIKSLEAPVPFALNSGKAGHVEDLEDMISCVTDFKILESPPEILIAEEPIETKRPCNGKSTPLIEDNSIKDNEELILGHEYCDISP